MTDVTARLSSFRECVRHLWNGYFLTSLAAASDKWALRDEFDVICRTLFGCIVVEPLGLAPARDAVNILSLSSDGDPRVLPWLRVVPNAIAPIMINRDPTAHWGYWDHPIERVKADEVELRFVRYFDFDELAFRDFRYYEVRIQTAARADIVGRAALIDCEYASVLLDASAFEASRPTTESSPR